MIRLNQIARFCLIALLSPVLALAAPNEAALNRVAPALTPLAQPLMFVAQAHSNTHASKLPQATDLHTQLGDWIDALIMASAQFEANLLQNFERIDQFFMQTELLRQAIQNAPLDLYESPVVQSEAEPQIQAAQTPPVNWNASFNFASQLLYPEFVPLTMHCPVLDAAIDWLISLDLAIRSVLALAIGILLSLFLQTGKRYNKIRSNAVLPTLGGEDSPEEYDYFQTDEGRLAMLDLVRAYVSMGEMERALAVLEHLETCGHDAIVLQAQQVRIEISQLK